MQSNFIESTTGLGCSPVNSLHIFGTPFPKKTCEGLLLSWLYFILNIRKLKQAITSTSPEIIKNTRILGGMEAN